MTTGLTGKVAIVTGAGRGLGLAYARALAAARAAVVVDASAGITGQCIGIGGNRFSIWSHPQEISVAYADGGWSADAIARTWSAGLGRAAQAVGIPAPQEPTK
jgi:NAD(P)-dependent dehydrogenase (short-subunit alcohol dehydrogenase family)